MKKAKSRIKYRKQEGITLIALVVTIVVLLILAGITINMLFSNGGIFKTAQDAANAWNEATVNEQESLNNLADQIANLVNGQVGGGQTPGEETPEVPDGWDLTKVTPVISKDETPVNVPVPNGFTASTVEEEQKVEEGFVITDGTNEFVWIPVNSEQLATMYIEAPGTPLSAYEGVDATTDVYSKLRDAYGSGATQGGAPGSTTNREPDILTSTGSGDASTDANKGIALITSTFGFSGDNGQVLDQFADMLVADYESSYESIKKDGGFYIGRYEITGSTTSPTVQKGQTVLVSQNWYNLYKACNGIVNTANAKSTMINGTQWDRVLEWLVETGMPSEDVYEDSSTWGNYSNYNTANGYTEGTPGYEEIAGKGVRLAGSSEYWKANNIYDLAGNAYERTQEASTTYNRVSRGGYYNSPGSGAPASYRFSFDPTSSVSYVSARPALYVAL